MPTHGSLSKAGKVRSQTPKIDSAKKHSAGPRINNRSMYYKRFTLARNVGQFKPRRRRR